MSDGMGQNRGEPCVGPLRGWGLNNFHGALGVHVYYKLQEGTIVVLILHASLNSVVSVAPLRRHLLVCMFDWCSLHPVPATAGFASLPVRHLTAAVFQGTQVRNINHEELKLFAFWPMHKARTYD